MEVSRGWLNIFFSRVVKETNRKDEVDSNMRWNKMINRMRRVANEEPNGFRGRVPLDKDTL